MPGSQGGNPALCSPLMPDGPRQLRMAVIGAAFDCRVCACSGARYYSAGKHIICSLLVYLLFS